MFRPTSAIKFTRVMMYTVMCAGKTVSRSHVLYSTSPKNIIRKQKVTRSPGYKIISTNQLHRDTASRILTAHTHISADKYRVYAAGGQNWNHFQHVEKQLPVLFASGVSANYLKGRAEGHRHLFLN